MTLFKQIAVLFSIFLTLLLLIVLALNFQSASKSVNERLFEDAVNTATSLSLSLGSAKGDISMMSIMIDANFDSGHYSKISLLDMDGALLHERKNYQDTLDVPQWFLEAINREAPMASANVSSGWNPVGILNVQSDISYANIQLYTILKDLFISFTLLGTLALLLVNALLIMILKPLKRVQFQAEAVTRNEFILVDTNIFTKEFRDVVVGMNTMVLKAKALFEKGNQALKKQKELEYTDTITKLKNHKYFMQKLPEYLKADAISKGGINILIALNGLVHANEEKGKKDVNTLLFCIANILNDYAKQYKGSVLTKISFSEFFILVPDLKYTDGTVLVDGIEHFVGDIIKEYSFDISRTYVSIGLSEYSYKDKIGVLLARADSALAHSKYLQNNKYLVKLENTDELLSQKQWKRVLMKAIEENKFAFETSRVLHIENKSVFCTTLEFNIRYDDTQTYMYEQFMLPAHQLRLSNSIYSTILNMLFKTFHSGVKGTLYSLKLSYEYLTLQSTYEEMQNIFSLYASKLPFTLVLEFPDKLAHEQPQRMQKYKVLFQAYKIDIGIGEFIGESNDFKYLQDLRPLYIKADKNYFVNQDKQILDALKLIADVGGITLIATKVDNVKIANSIREKNIFTVEGEVTKEGN
ncbi:EAL domain-containing protein [Sulfurimonas sp. SAG-AH-194-I05]|nr:LapD/MoxY N-terminal periplasmic domain-containing protein [Sulfurimonas sp. SAG-AH-194-I05]MDF1874283.1 EAL domain-containing protein [Sulfurimonas sp. SAG-AH-194-I05]